MYTRISQGPENNIFEIRSSSPYRKKVFQNGQFFGQSLSEVLRARPGDQDVVDQNVVK